ncbi:DUF6286 domain-containing protein [Nocardia sp. NPDC050710]|uniref:DUF6286 domain-containing protein n=1 Tax=Nocardia sp. NPDC050710 TaxID=3157220 RepID=UPI0033E024E3
MIRRSRRVLPATVLAVLVFALCVAVVVSLVQRLVGAHEYLSYDTIATELHGRAWDDLPVLIVGVVLAALGVLLLAVAVWPGRPAVLPLAASDELKAGVSRRGLRAALRSTAGSVDGVDTARIRLHRKTITVSGRAMGRKADGVAEEVCATLTRRVQEIGPPVRLVRARLRGKRDGT